MDDSVDEVENRIRALGALRHSTTVHDEVAAMVEAFADPVSGIAEPGRPLADTLTE